MYNETDIIRRLVGDITQEQLRYVDCFVSADISLFLPSVGPCFYAVAPAHTHPAYLFTLAFDDNCRIQIDDKTIRSKHRMICALSPGIVHHEIIESDFSRYVAIFIGERYFSSQLELYGVLDPPVFHGRLSDSTQEVNALIRDFMLEYETCLPGCDQVLQSIGVRLTHLLIRQMLHVKSGSVSRVNPRIQIDRSIEFIHANYGQKLSVQTMAEVVSLFPSHFARLFKRQTGQSPYEYLIGVRLRQGKKLLRVGDKSLVDIALECGFCSLSHFSWSFCRRFKCSPTEYRSSMSRHAEV